MRWTKERLCLCVETLVLLCVAVEYFSWQLPSSFHLHLAPSQQDNIPPPETAEVAPMKETTTVVPITRTARSIPNSGSLELRQTEGIVLTPLPTRKSETNTVATCANGSIFTRQVLEGSARVVVINQSPQATSIPLTETQPPFPQSSVFTLHAPAVGGKRLDVGRCITERLSTCNFNLTAPMADLLLDGSFDASRFSAKYTGENAMHDTLVYRRYFVALSCVVVYKPAEDHYARASSWEERASPLWHLHPVLNPLHGKVSPMRLIRQARYLLTVAGAKTVLNVLQGGFSGTSLPDVERLVEGDGYNIVEFGCGHAALLASMCPPVKGIRCYGSDFSAKLIEVGRKHFPWLQLEPSTKAPSIPNGWANLALSHAVMIYLKPDALCNHVLEGLRILRPGGKLVLWMLWLTPFGAGTRIHPSFFVHGVEWDHVTSAGYAANTSSAGHLFLPYCSEGIGDLVDRVELWLADESASIYAPRLNRGGPYGVVLRRKTNTRREQTGDVLMNRKRSIHSSPSIPTALSLYTDYFTRWRGYSALHRFDKMNGKWV